MISKVFSLMDYDDAVTIFFNAFCNNAKLQQLETIINARIDIRTIPLSDYKVELGCNGVDVVSAELSFGDMTFKFSLEEMPSWTARQYTQKGVTPPDNLLVQIFYQDAWMYHNTISIDSVSLDKWIEYTYTKIFNDIKRKVSITIREVKKYLANQAYYDMMEKELNIKQRKFKKK